MIIWRPEDENNERLTDQEIDENNMDAIDWYIEKMTEYNKKGYFTAFMGAKLHEEPPEPKLFNYSWETR